VARVYDAAGPDEGQRVLVDRVWPRGFRKEDPRVTATRDVEISQAAVLAALLNGG
jgi:uncharacterized protein YeaO (DUF488 family)